MVKDITTSLITRVIKLILVSFHGTKQEAWCFSVHCLAAGQEKHLVGKVDQTFRTIGQLLSSGGY
jgi:hypothetical protein